MAYSDSCLQIDLSNTTTAKTKILWMCTFQSNCYKQQHLNYESNTEILILFDYPQLYLVIIGLVIVFAEKEVLVTSTSLFDIPRKWWWNVTETANTPFFTLQPSKFECLYYNTKVHCTLNWTKTTIWSALLFYGKCHTVVHLWSVNALHSWSAKENNCDSTLPCMEI